MPFTSGEIQQKADKLSLQISGGADAAPGPQFWYNEQHAWGPIIKPDNLWNDYGLIPGAATPAIADANVIANPLILEKRKVRLTLNPTTNNRQFEARGTYGDRSTAIFENWVQPSMIRDSGGPSPGYIIRLYNGDPGAGGVEILTTQYGGASGEPAWEWNYSTGLLKVSTDQSATFAGIYAGAGLWVEGYRYIGATGGAGGGGTPSAIWDTDLDTGIDTEAAPDEDIIRFYTGAPKTERAGISATEAWWYNIVPRVARDDGNDVTFRFNGDNVGIDWYMGCQDSTNGDFAISENSDLTGAYFFIGGSGGAYTNKIGINTETPPASFSVAGSMQIGNDGGFTERFLDFSNTTYSFKLGDIDGLANGGFIDIDCSGASAFAVFEEALQLRFRETGATKTDYVGFRAPADVTTSVVWTLPPADGAPGQVLSTNGGGVLSWAAGGGGGSAIWDTDSDTGIDVEAAADSDDIRFYTNNGAGAAAERMRVLTNGRVVIDPAGSGTTNYQFEVKAADGDGIGLSSTRVLTLDSTNGFVRVGADAGTARHTYLTSNNGQVHIGSLGTVVGYFGSTGTAAVGQIYNGAVIDIRVATGVFNVLGGDTSGDNARLVVDSVDGSNAGYSASISVNSDYANGGDLAAIYLRNNGGNSVGWMAPTVAPAGQVDFKMPNSYGTVNQAMVCTDGAGTLGWGELPDIWDADADTGIDSEAAPDEDTLRFYTGPVKTERFTMAAGHFDLLPHGVGAGETGEARFLELAAGGTNYMALKAPDAVTSSVTLVLPDGDGNADQILKTDGSGQLGWADPNTVETWKAVTDPFTRVSDSSFTIIHGSANQAIFVPGRPIRYRATAGTWRYGLVKSYTPGAPDATVVIGGYPLTTSDDDEMQFTDVGGKTVVHEFFISGACLGNATNQLILDSIGKYTKWPTAPAFLVEMSVIVALTDTGGAAYPRVNARIAGSNVFSDNGGAGIEISNVDGTWVETGVTAQATYGISRGDSLELTTDANGTNDDAVDLTAQLVFVLE